MASLAANAKFSLRYNVASGTDSLSRTISGLNVSGGSSTPNSGPNRDTGITNLLTTLQSFTTGTLTNPRWIDEREVIM